MLEITNLSTNHYYYLYESFDENVKAKSYDETNFNEKKAICKMQSFYILFAFY